MMRDPTGHRQKRYRREWYTCVIGSQPDVTWWLVLFEDVKDKRESNLDQSLSL